MKFLFIVEKTTTNIIQDKHFVNGTHCRSESTCESQYCGEPPWPRRSVFGLRPPGHAFRILCLEDSVISIISPSSGGSLAQFSLYVHKGGLKPDLFHLKIGNHLVLQYKHKYVQPNGGVYYFFVCELNQQIPQNITYTYKHHVKQPKK